MIMKTLTLQTNKRWTFGKFIQVMLIECGFYLAVDVRFTIGTQIHSDVPLELIKLGKYRYNRHFEKWPMSTLSS